jgi:Cyclin, N-terminal domain
MTKQIKKPNSSLRRLFYKQSLNSHPNEALAYFKSSINQSNIKELH